MYHLKESSVRKFYVYAYINNDGTPYYIGVGTGDRQSEKHHADYCQPPADPALNVRVCDDMTFHESRFLEKQLIKFWGRRCTGEGPLENRAIGDWFSLTPAEQEQRANEANPNVFWALNLETWEIKHNSVCSWLANDLSLPPSRIFNALAGTQGNSICNSWCFCQLPPGATEDEARAECLRIINDRSARTTFMYYGWNLETGETRAGLLLKDMFPEFSLISQSGLTNIINGRAVTGYGWALARVGIEMPPHELAAQAPEDVFDPEYWASVQLRLDGKQRRFKSDEDIRISSALASGNYGTIVWDFEAGTAEVAISRQDFVEKLGVNDGGFCQVCNPKHKHVLIDGKYGGFTIREEGLVDPMNLSIEAFEALPRVKEAKALAHEAYLDQVVEVVMTSKKTGAEYRGASRVSAAKASGMSQASVNRALKPGGTRDWVAHVVTRRDLTPDN